MNVQQVIDAVAAKTGLDPAAAERAAGTILSVIQQEVDPSVAASLLAKMPGAAELAAANAVSASSGGVLGSIATSVLGNKAGILAAGFSQLEASGLTLTQIRAAAASIVAYAKTSAGNDIAKEITDALPGLVKQ
jgi:uncharacterized protein VcgC/VcgE DUF2780